MLWCLCCLVVFVVVFLAFFLLFSLQSHHFSSPLTSPISSPLIFLVSKALIKGIPGWKWTDGWKKFNLSCYKFFNVKTKWDKAKQHCSDLGSILVTIHSFEENQFVASLAPTYTTIWIGASDTVLEGTWVWLDGENWGGYANWGGSNPNNSRGKENCALTVNGKWNDVNCNLSHTYVCKTKNWKIRALVNSYSCQRYNSDPPIRISK